MKRNVLILVAVACVSFLAIGIYLFSAASSSTTFSPAEVSSGDQQQQSLKKKKLEPAPPLTESENGADPLDQFYSPQSSAVDEHCPKKHFSKADMEKHNAQDDLWILVHGWVLNVTAFVNHHPGGVAMIMKGGGGDKDAGQLFTQFHQPGTVSLFKQFCIGKFQP